MTTAVLSLCLLASALVQDSVPNAAALRQLALRGTDSSLAHAVRVSPVAARDALADLLDASADARRDDPPLAASSRLAMALTRELGDSFPARQVARFVEWTPTLRREKIAVDSLRKAGNARFRAAGWNAALPLWQQSAARAGRMSDTAGVAAATGNIGSGWYAEGQLDSAAAYFQRAAAVALTVGDRRTALNALGGLANVQRDRGELESARSLYLETSRLREAIGDERGLIADLINMSILAEELGDLRGADDGYQRALTRSVALGLEEPAAASRVNRGQLATLRGDFASARREYAAALATYRRLGHRSDEALVLRSIGLMEARRGDYGTAHRRLLEALVIYRRSGPAASVVRVHLDLAAIGVAIGSADEARRRVDTAAAAAARAPRDYALQTEVALSQGDLHAAFNRRDAADRAYRRADRLAEQAGDDLGRARGWAGRGYLLLGDDDAGAAIPLLERAVRFQEQASDQRAAALTRLDLATVLFEAGRPEVATSMAQVARDSLTALGDAAGEAASLGVLADFELSRARPAQAEALYRRALSEAQDPMLLQLRWPLHLGLARALDAQGNPARARAELAASIAAVEAGAASLSTERRSGWLTDKWEPWSMLARLEFAAGHDSTAFAVSERLRARELLEQLGRASVASRPGSDTALIVEEQALRRTISTLAGSADGALSQATALRGPMPRASSAAAREALAEAEGQYASLLEQVREREPNWAASVRTPEASWRTVAARLAPDAALLEYLVSDSSVMLFVVTPGKLRAIDLGTNRRTLASLVDFVRGALAEPPRRDRQDPTPAALERLHRILIEPAISAGALTGVRRLLIVPHAELHYLPFAALRQPAPDGRYLVERYDLAVVSSAGTWVQMEARPAARGAGVLAVAPSAAALPGTVAEVRAIAAAWGSAEVLSGAAAGKSEVMARAAGVDVLHIASYGVLNRRNPLFSYVELAPAGRADGRLEVHEVYGLPLDASLVVLSACQTAVGSGMVADVPAGDDWVSLSRAFLVAGARRVVASLWLVEDRATADLMSLFHRSLARGEAPSAALGRAQRELLAQPARAHPFYWAGFTTVGGL